MYYRCVECDFLYVSIILCSNNFYKLLHSLVCDSILKLLQLALIAQLTMECVTIMSIVSMRMEYTFVTLVLLVLLELEKQIAMVFIVFLSLPSSFFHSPKYLNLENSLCTILSKCPLVLFFINNVFSF